jgi:hypothetical protein
LVSARWGLKNLNHDQPLESFIIQNIEIVMLRKLRNIEWMETDMKNVDSGRALFTFFLLVCHTISECKQGIDFYWGGNYEETLSRAYAESGYPGLSKVAELRGSFVSRITGLHTFELWSDTYGVSIGFTPSTKFLFDGSDRGTHELKWQWSAGVLAKDFRYQMRLTVQDKIGRAHV